jgi:glycosyltransferase involved in cell wall biosynthesis
MIVTNVGGLTEIIPDGKVGYVVDCEPKKISEAIIKFYKKKKEQEFVKNVEIEKQKYSWDRMLESINFVFEKTKSS